MEWDDARPKPQKAAVLGEDLQRLSVAELQARLELLRAEIVRVDTALAAKQAQVAAAAKLFKS
jgi:uncharacterized small protein (DUF1192 family)